MSHMSKEEDSNPTDPNALSADVSSLTSEYKKLDAQLSAINHNIQVENEKIAEAQQVIANNRSQGLQLVGQANVVSRILLDMGVDVQSLVTPPPMPEPVIATPPVDIVPEELEETSTKSRLRNRFSSQ
jgi:hypothetical protein